MLWLFLYIAHIFYFQQLMLFEFTVKRERDKGKGIEFNYFFVVVFSLIGGI